MKSALLLKLLASFVFVFFLHGIAFSQPPNPEAGTDPDNVPITGIEILIGSGAILGARKLARLRKKK